MSATPVRRKVDALLQLAGGGTNRAAATAAGVSPSTITAWRRDPVFARELAVLREVVEREPFDGRAVMAAVDEAEARLSPSGPQTAAGGAFTVTVAIPAGASPRQRERLVARALGRALARGAAEVERGQS